MRDRWNVLKYADNHSHSIQLNCFYLAVAHLEITTTIDGIDGFGGSNLATCFSQSKLKTIHSSFSILNLLGQWGKQWILVHSGLPASNGLFKNMSSCCPKSDDFCSVSSSLSQFLPLRNAYRNLKRVFLHVVSTDLVLQELSLPQNLTWHLVA